MTSNRIRNTSGNVNPRKIHAPVITNTETDISRK